MLRSNLKIRPNQLNRYTSSEESKWSTNQPPTQRLLSRRLRADVKAGRSLLQRQTLFHNTDRQLLSTMNRKSGILVIVHPIPPIKLIRHRTSFSQLDRMDNLLKLHN